MSKELIVIAGPTASGKTGLAVQLAKKFDTSVLSADSRQCFREMNIGVAKPTQVEMQGIEHYFIGSHSIHDTVNAGAYEQYALNILENIFSKNDRAILVGGTGLYINALCNGLDNIPTVPTAIRHDITTQYDLNGLAWLQQQVQSLDPAFWEQTNEKENPQRLMRALEIMQGTRKSILSFRTKKSVQRDFVIRKYAIEWPRPQLYERINLRVDQMIKDGLLDEVKSLNPYRNLNALQTVGYSELWDFMDGKLKLKDAIEKIKINTRHYAKRQITWFKRDVDYQWINGAETNDFVEKFQ